MATADHVAVVTTAPGPFIVLQAKSGDTPISITLHYAAIRELRGCVKPGLGASGLLFGRRTEDSAEIEHCSATAAGGTPPIGLFRTQAAGWPVVTEEDCRRVQQLLTVTPSDALFLVVRTLAQRPWAATLFAINPKQPTTAAAPILEFPFDEYVLQNGWLLDLAPPPTLLPRMTEEPEPPRRNRSWLALAAAVALIGGGGAAAYQFHWLPWRAEGQLNDAPDAVSPLLPLTAIALRVERSNDDFEVRWNRSSEAVQTATAGTLIIRNGPVTRIVPLSAGQLREGHVQYRPLTGVDADFRLELMAGDGKLEAESVQVLGFNTTPPLAPGASSPNVAPPPATLPPEPVRPTPRPRGARPEPSRPAQHMADRADSAGVVVAPSPDRPEPVPIRRAYPDVTREVTEEMRKAGGKVTVSVLVSIDAAGNVGSAKVLSSTGEANSGGQRIRLASLKAARQWKFRPATVGGRPSPSSLTLVFTF